METNTTHLSPFVRAPVRVLIYLFLLWSKQTIDFVRLALFALLLFHRRRTRCIAQHCARCRRIFLFNLITNGNFYCATAASLIICYFHVFFHSFSSNRISAQIFAIHIWTWLSSGTALQMATDLCTGSNAESGWKRSGAPKQHDRIIRRNVNEKRTRKKRLSHAHDDRVETETICAWFAPDFHISSSGNHFYYRSIQLASKESGRATENNRCRSFGGRAQSLCASLNWRMRQG